MRLSSSTCSILPLLAALALAAPARGESVRLIRADDRGVTLGLEVGAFELKSIEGGRFEVVGSGLPELVLPGRPRVPNGYALIALPPGATATATVVGGSAEELREPVRLAIGDRPSFRNDYGPLGLVPTSEPAAPILDGPWPSVPVEVSAPFTMRRQTVVGIQIRPFRYDEASSRLWTRRSIIVRVDFLGGGGASLSPAREDRHWEPVLKGAVLNYEQGRRWRVAPQRSRPAARTSGSLFAPPAGGAGALQGAAFDEDETEVRVRIDTTGVYGFEYAKLAAAGFPPNVPIGELSVHRHEYTGTGIPPYATIELPIEVEEGVNRNGTFDTGDRILAFAQTWAERSSPSPAQRSWGDADYVYVTRLRSRAPRHVALRSGWLGTTPPVLPSYPWSQHFEKNLTYMTFPPDTNMDLYQWTSLMEYYTRPDTIRFETNHLDATRNVDISVSIMGRKQSTHFTWIQVENGSSQFTYVADSVFWSGKTMRDFPATLPGTALSEGRTNRLKLWGKDIFADPDPVGNGLATAGLNAFDVTYWRRYRALAGLLSCNSGDAAGDFEILADGFATDSIRAWDVSDPASPVRLTDVVIATSAPYTLRLQDNLAAGPPRPYVIFSTPKLLPSNRYSPVAPHQLYAAGAGDYLLITPEAFLTAANALAAQRTSQGMNVVVAPLEAVNDEFNGGRKSPYAIRRFVRYAYDNWDARFVLLMGDASEDPQNLGGSAGTDWIPSQLVLGPVGVFLPDGYLREVVLSDNWFVWAVDTPPAVFAPLVPDLYIGRLPVNNLTQASDMVSKLIAYEHVDTTQTWRRRILIHADDAWSGETTFGGGGGGSGYCFRPEETKFVSLSQAVRAVIADSAGLALCEPEIFDMNVWLAGQTVDVNNCRPDRNATIAWTRGNITFLQLFPRLNDGRLWWNYQGHANATVLEHESVYWKGGFPNDVNSFTNVGKPFLFTAFSCHANAFGQPKERDFSVGPSIGEDMVTLPGAGAIASWASSGYEIIPSSATDHLNVTLAKSLFSDPPRDDFLGKGASAVLGEGIGLTLIRNWTARQGSPFERDVTSSYILLGDPATRLSIGPPQITVTANHVPVTDGLPVLLPGQADTLRIDADFVSNAAIDSISLERTDETSTVILPPSAYTLSPPFPDTSPGGGGGRRFHLVYNTSLSSGTFRYTLRSRDRYGVITKFDIVFAFQTVLLDGGRPLRNGDAVASDAVLTLLVLSPNTLVPANDLVLTIDGSNQPFTAAPANGDVTNRQFILSWTYPPYPPYPTGTHILRLDVKGSLAATHEFRVVPNVRLDGVVNFPNPFDDELGTRFTFNLLSDAPADLMVRVYTTNGRMVYERTERNLPPGHHELAWDGRDAEGDKLANGVYLYRMVAKGRSGSASESGRLVKLRKPRQAPSETTP